MTPDFDIETSTECPKCGLEAKSLLHRHCTLNECPVREALKVRDGGPGATERTWEPSPAPVTSLGVGAGHVPAFTPGPWHWREDLAPIPLRVLSPGVLILDNDPGCGGPWGDEIDRANARLIAAAPDLLRASELLEAAEDFNANDCRECEGEGVPELCPVCFPKFDDARVARRAAIAKATGQGSAS